MNKLSKAFSRSYTPLYARTFVSRSQILQGGGHNEQEHHDSDSNEHHDEHDESHYDTSPGNNFPIPYGRDSYGGMAAWGFVTVFGLCFPFIYMYRSHSKQ